ncbi:platelet-activating factor acetylhydrolase [Diplodia corticola]|uniref:Putative phospholipase n=1 Tax=Diplodia corticola TaxID=236234 RepID=A0A1J9R291_9PEZI|nr:platelet-activating factor acetylhydrolase [Diplodia corticola]OJD34354.1 platelet-activating factor acetylhydrolase [Diplodia corticola]
MAWLSTLNPVPGFPEYSGPYKVGSFDVEIPVSELESPSPPPASSVSTVSFRVFYPCEPGAKERAVRWIPSPQRGYVSAYARFLGAGSALAQVFAYCPQFLYYTTVPVNRNARLLPPPTNSSRWPVMIFSHGLGGSRNAYSQICGSISSHGMVVIAPDHRDGSAPISYVRATDAAEANIVDYQNVPHKPGKEVFDARDSQLKIRLWELGLIHDAVLKMGAGVDMKNLDSNKSRDSKKDSSTLLSMFQGKLDVNRPGSISWAGHSFGAATVHQLVKSTFYRPDSRIGGYTPLFTPAPASSIVQQITSSSPVILLDIWCLPLTSPNTKWLADKPMPCYAPEGPGGTALLAILSEAFVKWADHFQETKRRLSEDPSSDAPRQTKPAPRFFYPLGSAHLSQSDFGILFRWVVKKFLKTDEPERYMTLNVRAILQMLRENDFEVADTSRAEMEEGEASGDKNGSVAAKGKTGDWKILETNGAVRGWVALSTSLDKPSDGAPHDADAKGEPLSQVIKNEGVEL